MKDLSRAGMTPNDKRAEFLSGPSITMNCSAPDSGGAAGFLPEFTNETDQYLAEGAKPLFFIPLWAWVLVGTGAAWWFWGRHHVPHAPTWLGGKG
jgi:hypothetical protein